MEESFHTFQSLPNCIEHNVEKYWILGHKNKLLWGEIGDGSYVKLDIRYILNSILGRVIKNGI